MPSPFPAGPETGEDVRAEAAITWRLRRKPTQERAEPKHGVELSPGDLL